MGTESLAAGATMLVVELGMVVVGIMGAWNRIEYSLGGWTRETATPASWQRAHRTIGVSFVTAGSVAIVSGLVSFWLPSDSAGVVAVAGSIVMLVPTVSGIVRGLGQLERR